MERSSPRALSGCYDRKILNGSTVLFGFLLEIRAATESKKKEKMSAPHGMESVIAEMIVRNRPKMENGKRLAAQELQNTKLELATAENVSKEYAAELTKNDNRFSHLKALSGVMEQTLMEFKAECNCLRDEMDAHTEHVDKLMDDLREQTSNMCDGFTSAPDRFAIEKVTEEIEIESKEFEDVSFKIQSKLDPDIEASKRLMENEPFTLLEVPGSSSAELKAEALDALIFSLQEHSKEQTVTIEQCENEKIALEKEEEIYGP